MTVKIDEFSQQFLGSKDVQVHQGQTADKTKLERMREQYLIQEAAEFGDIITNYIANHPRIDPTQRAFGLTLSILNLRHAYPAGTDLFDDLADQGGKDLQISATPVPDAANAPATRLSDAAEETAAQFSELLTKYVTMKKNQLGTSNYQTAYGLGRAFHNLRSLYPSGPEVFDTYAAQAGEYFARNT